MEQKGQPNDRQPLGGRKLKKKILGLLKDHPLETSLEKMGQFPPRQALNPLFSFFCHPDEFVKWRAVTAMGAVVARLAQEDMESARIVMRRLMWHLNDESGGIGWGAPEAMGEIMARHEKLAEEYAAILASYINPSGNFIEHEILQRGVLWGLGRLAHSRPQLLADTAAFLLPFLRSKDSVHRGLAAWVSGALSSGTTTPLLQKLVADEAKITIYIRMNLVETTVGDLAQEALAQTTRISLEKQLSKR
jgi:hypothetical protein